MRAAELSDGFQPAMFAICWGSVVWGSSVRLLNVSLLTPVSLALSDCLGAVPWLINGVMRRCSVLAVSPEL